MNFLSIVVLVLNLITGMGTIFLFWLEKRKTEEEKNPKIILYVGTLVFSISMVLHPVIIFYEKSQQPKPLTKEVIKNVVVIGQKDFDKKLSAIDENISALIKKSNIDPRKISEYLDKVPFEKGKEVAIKTIDRLYIKKSIPLDIREILFITTETVFERTDELAREINDLKSRGNTSLAKSLGKVKLAVENRNPDSLLKIYENFNKREKNNKVILLEELIKSSTSIFAYEEAKKFYYDLTDIEPSAINHFSLAYFLAEFNFSDEASSEYEKALKIYRELAKENPRTYLPDLAMTLNNLAALQKAKNEFPQASEKYQEALKIYRKLANENPRIYSPNVAMTLNNLAILQQAKNEFPQALEKYQNALEIYRELTNENHRNYLPDFANTLNNMAVLHSIKNEYPEALEKFQEALMIRKELAKEKPITYLPDLAKTLNNLANLQQLKNEFSQAFEKYQEALKIYRELANKNPRTYLPDVAMTLNNLAILQQAKNEFPQALEKYEEALKIYRNLANENPQTYGIDYARTLIIGVKYFGREKKTLKESKKILKNYSGNYSAQKLLQMITKLE